MTGVWTELSANKRVLLDEPAAAVNAQRCCVVFVFVLVFVFCVLCLCLRCLLNTQVSDEERSVRAALEDGVLLGHTQNLHTQESCIHVSSHRKQDWSKVQQCKRATQVKTSTTDRKGDCIV
jgi:hypothetical protein